MNISGTVARKRAVTHDTRGRETRLLGFYAQLVSKIKTNPLRPNQKSVTHFHHSVYAAREHISINSASWYIEQHFWNCLLCLYVFGTQACYRIAQLVPVVDNIFSWLSRACFGVLCPQSYVMSQLSPWLFSVSTLSRLMIRLSCGMKLPVKAANRRDSPPTVYHA